MPYLFIYPYHFGHFIKNAHDRKHDTTNKGLKNAGSEILKKPKKAIETKWNERGTQGAIIREKAGVRPI